MKRTIIRVQWIKARQRWRLSNPDPHQTRYYERKRQAVNNGRAICRMLGEDGFPCQLFIHTKAGKIARKGEHTYPRSSDPRRTPG
jgi:hypothetical protein